VNTKDDVLKNVCNQTVDVWKSTPYFFINCLVTHILQNILCAAEERNSYWFETTWVSN